MSSDTAEKGSVVLCVGFTRSAASPGDSGLKSYLDSQSQNLRMRWSQKMVSSGFLDYSHTPQWGKCAFLPQLVLLVLCTWLDLHFFSFVYQCVLIIKWIGFPLDTSPYEYHALWAHISFIILLSPLPILLFSLASSLLSLDSHFQSTDSTTVWGWWHYSY